jgi:hypothetical protein
MEQQDDYVAGPHHYGTHLICGIIFGAILGGWTGSQLSNSGWIVLGAAVLGAFCVGYSCGRWGDRAWHWIIERLL